jgi:hypothetical protein
MGNPASIKAPYRRLLTLVWAIPICRAERPTYAAVSQNEEKQMRILNFLVPAMLGLMSVLPAKAADTSGRANDLAALYTPCTFYPQGERCREVYERALQDNSPMAYSVRQAFTQYARYLKPTGAGLTEEDRKFLGDNNIEVPKDLNAESRSGLHNVINDPSLHNLPERSMAVRGFLSRAVASELYCGLNVCDARTVSAMS